MKSDKSGWTPYFLDFMGGWVLWNPDSAAYMRYASSGEVMVFDSEKHARDALLAALNREGTE